MSASGQSAPPASPPGKAGAQETPPPQRTPTLQTTQTQSGTTTEAPTEAPKTDRTTTGPSTRATDSLDATDKIDAPKAASGGRFEFGSYGRVQVASDLRGGTGKPANVVAHGTRIDEDSYAELELRREDDFAHGIHTKVVATLALFAPFFHFDGQEAQSLAVRNLYAQAQYGQLTMWVGSRMYRGDDVYLLDWWPLDTQNTYGGGLGWQFDDKNSVAVHAGMTRLDDPTYQYQQIQVVAPFGSGVTNVTTLDRPRIVESAKYTHLIIPRGQSAGVKLIAYGEGHEIGAGTTTDTVTSMQQALPSDWGFMVGGEAAFFTGKRDTFLQLFVRHARGLAAYDPLATPTTFGQDRTTQGANETLLALGGNYERDWFGLLVGGYLRFFRDAAATSTSLQKYDEGTAVVRGRQLPGAALRGDHRQLEQPAGGQRVARRRHPLLFTGRPRLLQAPAVPAALCRHRAQRGSTRALRSARRLRPARRRALPRRRRRVVVPLELLPLTGAPAHAAAPLRVARDPSPSLRARLP